MDTIAISDLRANLPRLVNQVAERFRRFVVTVSGRPKAVLISLDELESLEETAEILSLPGAYEKIKKGAVETKKGEGITLDKLE